MDKQAIPPGRELKLGNIPVAITDDHNESYYYWQFSGLENATLFHIDAHSDMKRGAPLLEYCNGRCEEEKYFMFLDIDKFVAPAFSYGIVSTMFWLNPHSHDRELQFMGSDLPDEEERRIWTYESSKWLNYDHHVFSAKREQGELFDDKGNYLGIPKRIEEIKISGDRPFILNIDLDAFCCFTRDIQGVPDDYQKLGQGVRGYGERIKRTVQILERLNTRPDLVTISLSKGKKVFMEEDFMEYTRKCGERLRDEQSNRYFLKTASFVPSEHRDYIERRVIDELGKLYESQSLP